MNHTLKMSPLTRAFPLLFWSALCIAATGCGGESPQKNDDTFSRSTSPSDSLKSQKDPSPDTLDRPSSGPKHALKASGTTEDGTPVQLNGTVQDNKVVGTLQIDNVSLNATGMLDGNIIRCWLKGGGDNAFYRGNLVAQKQDQTVQGNFTVSSNAGENVIKGTLTK
jgi:hypothetical protein